MSTTHFEVRYALHPDDYPHYTTDALRDEFLIPKLFVAGEVHWVYSHYDRYMAGGAMPTSEALALETIAPLRAKHFLARRELGVINVGGPGVILVGERSYSLAYKEALYIGSGEKEVSFKSEDPQNPALFYLNSAPAHKSCPDKKISQADAEIVELGSLETSNARTIRKLIVNSVVESCQLQMGMTELKVGSVWNTMPAHVHDRRMEVYFYFEVPENQAVCHFMGPADNTRNIWMQNQQAVISPPWSMHCGAGTSNYTFIWGMAGENLDYGDMDTFSPTEMR